MNNIPVVKVGVVSVSRDCFPISLSAKRKEAVKAECAKKGLENVYVADTIIENELDAMKALEELKNAGANALALYLGNFGPEIPEMMLAQKFDGPVMVAAAAEESQKDLIDGRGDAYCGMLNASYNLSLRGVKAYIPEYPVGTPDEIADMIADFENIARVVIGLHSLKIFSFGPRPYDFMACNAPISPLYKTLGVEIQENSELDLFASFNEHKDDERIPAVAEDMAKELGLNNPYAGILPRLAQYELTLLDWAEANKGACKYFVFANKCWPAFQTQFGLVPCYVNSRLAARGIPVACETDIYGAVTEYIITCATQKPATLLDINNSVPKDMFEANPEAFAGYKLTDTFMGFHCGNTPICCLKSGKMGFQRIMKRTLEPDKEPDITRGTIEGNLIAGDCTIFRLQSTKDCELRSYIAQGEIADVDCQSFGGIGTFMIHEMGRFYRHVLVAKNYPHHAGIAFEHAGKTLYAAMKLMGIEDVCYNQPAGLPYKDENPFG
ncbi:MAG: fucose isomerase [Clostridia bacterium]|nr:fucose isomerase [Clostridia bacterium]